MKVLFWFCLALVAYTYFGYAIWLWLCVRLRTRRPILQSPIMPGVSIIIAARNEEATLPAKLENLCLLDYPQEQLQIIVVSDGSTDRTADFTSSATGQVISPSAPSSLNESNGKAFALNDKAVQLATGDYPGLPGRAADY